MMFVIIITYRQICNTYLNFQELQGVDGESDNETDEQTDMDGEPQNSTQEDW